MFFLERCGENPENSISATQPAFQAVGQEIDETASCQRQMDAGMHRKEQGDHRSEIELTDERRRVF
jgi:hypothetical protein